MAIFFLLISHFILIRIVLEGFDGLGGDFKDMWEDRYYIFGNRSDWEILGI